MSKGGAVGRPAVHHRGRLTGGNHLQNCATLGIVFLGLGILIFSLQDAVIKFVSGE